MDRLAQQAKSPLYHAVKETLRRQIEESYRPGDKIPPEAVLTEEFGVSQITVRRAIYDLVREGLLYRRQGRGTFVTGPKFTQNLTILSSFTELAMEQHRIIRSQTVAINVLDDKASIAAHRGLEPPLLEVIRLRIVDEDPIVLNSSYYSEQLFPNLGKALKQDPNTSIYALLREQYSVEFSIQEQTLEMAFVDDWEAQLLDIEGGSPVFLFNIKTQNQNNLEIEHVRALYRSDRCKFSMFPRRS